MSDWDYVTMAWVITVAALVAYAFWIVLRGRALSRRVPPEDRRWT